MSEQIESEFVRFVELKKQTLDSGGVGPTVEEMGKILDQTTSRYMSLCFARLFVILCHGRGDDPSLIRSHNEALDVTRRLEPSECVPVGKDLIRHASWVFNR